MAASRVSRAVLAFPFLVLAALCLDAMDIDKLKAQQMPFLAQRHITWDNGTKSIPILDQFYRVPFLDDMWRGITVSFSPGYLSDPISWWQIITFLNDLAPLYAVWYLESCRVGNAWTPAYIPTLSTFIAQSVGVGNVAPVFYFLHIVFAPTASTLKRSSKAKLIMSEQISCLLPMFLGFSTFEVARAYFATDPNTRHYWIWAWQMSPLWIGVANAILSPLADSILPFSKSIAASSKTLLIILCLVSSSFWIFALTKSPYSLAEIFVPVMEVQTGFIEHTRRAFQCDEVFGFASSYLWLLYMFFDLYSADMIGHSSFLGCALLPVVALLTGPGTAFALGWFWRETILQAPA